MPCQIPSSSFLFLFFSWSAPPVVASNKHLPFAPFQSKALESASSAHLALSLALVAHSFWVSVCFPPLFYIYSTKLFYPIWCKVANDCMRFCACGCCSLEKICSSVRPWLVSHNLLTSVHSQGRCKSCVKFSGFISLNFHPHTHTLTWKHVTKAVCPCNWIRAVMLGALCPQPWPAGLVWCPCFSCLQPLNRPAGDKHSNSSSHNLSPVRGF